MPMTALSWLLLLLGLWVLYEGAGAILYWLQGRRGLGQWRPTRRGATRRVAAAPRRRR